MCELSVIILTYNHEKFIDEAINSVINQITNFDFEIIIGDDCSKDRTIDIVKTYAKRVKNFKFITHSQNVGTTMNLCDCLEASNAEYFTYFGGDDYWINNFKLQKQYDFLKSNFDYLGVCNKIRAIDFDKKISVTYPREQIIKEGISLKGFMKGRTFPISGVLVKNISKFQNWNNLKEVILTDRLIEDFSLSLILLDIGKIAVIDEILAVYRIRSSELNAQNYNSIVSFNDKYLQHIKLYSKLKCYYPNLNFNYFILLKINELFFYCLRRRIMNNFYEEYIKINPILRIIFILQLPIRTISVIINAIRKQMI